MLLRRFSSKGTKHSVKLEELTATAGISRVTARFSKSPAGTVGAGRKEVVIGADVEGVWLALWGYVWPRSNHASSPASQEASSNKRPRAGENSEVPIDLTEDCQEGKDTTWTHRIAQPTSVY